MRDDFELDNFGFDIFDEYGDCVLRQEFKGIPRIYRKAMESLLDVIFCATDYDLNREVSDYSYPTCCDKSK